MKLQTICERYAAFRKTLGERFEVNERQLKAFCRAMGANIDIADVSPEKVNIFLVGKGPLTTSWYVRHNALLGFYRYAISRALVATSPLPLAIPKRPPAFQPYIYSLAELRRILDSIESCRRPRSDLDAPVMRSLVLLMYGAALRTSEALSLTIGDVDRYIKSRSAGITRATVKLRCNNTRCLLRFLHGTGRIPRDLAASLMGPTLYRFEGIPSTIRPEQIDAILAGVVNADNDQRLDLSGGDQRLSCLVNAPLLAGDERRCPVEQILSVVHVEHGITFVLFRIIVGRQIDDDITIVI